MNPVATSPGRGRLRGLAMSQLLAMSLLAICVWWVYRELELVVSVSKIIGAISWQSEASGVLNARLAAFGLATVIAHAGLGLAAWLLARLTLVAFPGLAETRVNALVAGWFLLLAALALDRQRNLVPRLAIYVRGIGISHTLARNPADPLPGGHDGHRRAGMRMARSPANALSTAALAGRDRRACLARNRFLSVADPWIRVVAS